MGFLWPSEAGPRDVKAAFGNWVGRRRQGLVSGSANVLVPFAKSLASPVAGDQIWGPCVGDHTWPD